MAKLPEPTKTTAAQIVQWWGKKPQGHRPHLGASLIGKPCERALWYTFRWAKTPTFDGRMLRLFNRGQLEEARFVEELRGIGATVYEVDPDTGNQIRVSAVDGHFGGSCDGVGTGLPEAPKSYAVLEFKTHSNKSFTDLKAKGVKASKPEHYAQMTVYGERLDLDRALYLAVNKDTDEIYSEWIHIDKDFAEQLLAKAERIIHAPTPPEKLSKDPAYFQCKFCDYWDVCHQDKVPEPNCRTCCNATPAEAGAWKCSLKAAEISEKEQLAGCDGHLYIPGLITYAEIVDGGENHVEYKKADGSSFTNGSAPGQYLSKELFVLDPSMAGDKFIDQLKEEFPGTKVVGGILDLEEDLEPVYRKETNTKEAKEMEKKKAANAAYLKAARGG